MVNSLGANELPVISAISNLKFFTEKLTETEIINVLSDLKHRIFPRPFERLSNLRDRKEGLTGIEIGVAGGEHALSLLENLDIKKLYLVDPYALYEEYPEGKSHYGVDQLPLSNTEIICREKLKAFDNRIVWIKQLSSKAVNFIDEKVDFVYIDGNHQEECVIEDIENYLPLLKQSGVIGGHDFYNGFQREHDGVVSAVTNFINNKKYQLRIETPDWWVET
jgi:hypothetical protein